MDYQLHTLSDDTFENLVNTICQEILGTGIVAFSSGPDGGRDGKFTGTAEKYPSSKDSWSGKFIIQAKHTSNPVASCSDSDFIRKFENEEIPKIKTLKKNGDVDNYIIFTNRKYAAKKGEELLKKIIKETEVKNVSIIGLETINLYLNSSKHIVRQYGLNKLSIPFDFSEKILKDIIVNFRHQLRNKQDALNEKTESIKYDLKKIDIEEKNQKNNLSKTYFEQEILANSLEHFDKIDTFLEHPNNSSIKDDYYDCLTELNNLIIINRSNFGEFEQIIVHIYQIVCNGDVILKGNKRFVYIFLHYMYYTCSIGEK